MSQERLLLRPETFYADQGITLKTDCRVTAIDPEARVLSTSDGAVAYDELVLTTGSTPRRLPAAIGGALEGVFTVRDLADVDAMAPRFVRGAKVLIVGGGYIGLEAAAVAAKLGLEVTLVEMADRILQRVAAPETSDYFRALHESHGVRLREGVGLERLLGEGHVTGARLSDGTEIAADFVITGVGIAPDIALAAAAGSRSTMASRSMRRGARTCPASGRQETAPHSPIAAGASVWKACRTPSNRPRSSAKTSSVRARNMSRNRGSGLTNTM